MIKEKKAGGAGGANDENDSLVINFQIKEDPAEHIEQDRAEKEDSPNKRIVNNDKNGAKKSIE